MIRSYFQRVAHTTLSTTLALFALAGCVSGNGESLESNTNWLFVCASDSECGDGLSCHCGACTRACAETACPSALSCVQADSCKESTPSCQVECTNDTDCAQLSGSAECQDGVCVMPSKGLGNKAVSTPRSTQEPEPTEPSDETASSDERTSSNDPSASETDVSEADLSELGSDLSELGSDLSEPPEETDPHSSDTEASDPQTVLKTATDAGNDGAACRYAYVEYAAGDKVFQDDCNHSTCTCTADGTLTECMGTDIGCDTHFVQRCSDMFPELGADEPIPSDGVHIDSAIMKDGKLELALSHGGGCEEHEYAICLRDIPDSDPLGVDLVLIHDGHDDACDALLSKNLTYEFWLLETDKVERGSTWSGALVNAGERYVLGEHLAEACVMVNPTPIDGVPQLTALLASDAAETEPVCPTLNVDETTEVISETAARCIAEGSGLEVGLDAWSSELSCDLDEEAVVWAIRNTTSVPDDGGPVGRTGRTLKIDAQTGSVLGSTGWGTSFTN